MGHDARTGRDFAGPQPEDDPTIRRELAPGERLVWQGQPGIGRLMLRSLAIALFGVPFTGFALFWAGMAARITAESPFALAKLFPLFSLPFLVVGGGMVLAPVWGAWQGTKTRYAITDRRALVCEPRLGSGIQTRSFAADALTHITRNQRGDGSGDLIFEEVRTLGRKGELRTTRHGFFAILDVRRAETILRETLLTNRTA